MERQKNVFRFDIQRKSQWKKEQREGKEDMVKELSRSEKNGNQDLWKMGAGYKEMGRNCSVGFGSARTMMPERERERVLCTEYFQIPLHT